MTSSINRRLLVAGATATALLTLSVFCGSANASAAPATSAAAAGPCRDTLTSHNFAVYLDNNCVEFILEVSGMTGNTVTLVRGAAHSQAFTDFILSSRRKNFSVALLDSQNRTIKQYNFRNAQAIRYGGGSVTFQFQEIVIS
ncbi:MULTISPECIES: hypothetical protein [unclassified Streptomyces]|uniref:hypothetical protein n=1 Tax=unclassified Streptomyces TaxID=2593676 RepID=UPI002E249AA2